MQRHFSCFLSGNSRSRCESGLKCNTCKKVPMFSEILNCFLLRGLYNMGYNLRSFWRIELFPTFPFFYASPDVDDVGAFEEKSPRLKKKWNKLRYAVQIMENTKSTHCNVY
ncbi:hypothetical protein POVCU1_007000 [Plasmodium ovale curtisi]|uniref:Uncharacterized protein n=1 Tax=Plasmodium ovale curtisi TaxID=864141 RepID=A0A1A8VTY5_PLAOA|nr:hypothetical protein POVCU1_007000 [Plasmodium ovale curtisi]